MQTAMLQSAILYFAYKILDILQTFIMTIKIMNPYVNISKSSLTKN